MVKSRSIEKTAKTSFRKLENYEELGGGVSAVDAAKPSNVNRKNSNGGNNYKPLEPTSALTAEENENIRPGMSKANSNNNELHHYHEEIMHGGYDSNNEEDYDEHSGKYHNNNNSNSNNNGNDDVDDEEENHNSEDYEDDYDDEEEENSDEEDDDNGEIDDEDIWTIKPKLYAYYENQFKTMQPDLNGVITGSVAKPFFEKSKLPLTELSRIWFVKNFK